MWTDIDFFQMARYFHISWSAFRFVASLGRASKRRYFERVDDAADDAIGGLSVCLGVIHGYRGQPPASGNKLTRYLRSFLAGEPSAICFIVQFVNCW